jgi:type IV pilus assembly protein PilM
MIFNRQKKQKKRISLIIKDYVIRMVETKSTKINEVKVCKERYIPEGIIQDGKIEDLSSLELILEECVTEWGIKGRHVHFAIPNGAVTLRKEKIPAEISTQEMKGYLYLEIGSSIHLPFEEPVFDFVIVDEQNDYKEILLFAAPEKLVQQYVAVIERVKLKVKSVEPSFLSLYRLYELVGKAKPEEALLMLQFGVKAVTITIFHEDKPVLSRHVSLNIPFDKWDQKIVYDGTEILEWKGDMETLQNEVDEVILESERIMKFYRFSLQQDKRMVEHILLCGDYPNLDEIKEQMNEVLSLSVEVFHQSSLMTIDNQEIPQRFYDSIGLACKEVS